MRLAVGSVYGTVFNGSFEMALLWLSRGLDISIVMLKRLTLLTGMYQQQQSAHGCEHTPPLSLKHHAIAIHHQHVTM